MAVTRAAEINMARVEELIEQEEKALEPKHRRSIAFREKADEHVAGGVASSWQDAPPHAVYVSEGKGSKIWDLDGNEYVDYHNGYGVMVVGHAHPKIVDAVQKRVEKGTHFAQPGEEIVPVAENLTQRFKLPLWRFGNSGTESTLDAVRLMRAATGRDLLIKIEGTYHGHHDSLMVSVMPEADKIGPRDHPSSVPQTLGLPQVFADLVRVVPYNDLDALERILKENEGRVAGMFIEPAMMNAGIIPPDPGYLEGVRELTKKHGVYLAFDEVKTGCAVAWGGAVERFGVVPDIVCLAKVIGGGLPCGAIGGTEELFSRVISGEMDLQGTFNGNPLTMTASLTTLTEVLTPDAYEHLEKLNTILTNGINDAIDRYALPAYVLTFGAKGSVIYSRTPVRDYRDHLKVDERISYLAWLVQQNRGVFKSPWAKTETWTIGVQHSEDDARLYVANFEELAAMLAA
jgi:glutamate-1-semialdehyde 2,1-aminomutase